MRELRNSRAASTRLLIKLGEEVVLSAHFYTKKALQKIFGYFFFKSLSVVSLDFSVLTLQSLYRTFS